MIIVLVGESASGKSTLARWLSDYDKSFSRVVTYTTRPMRDGEVDGVDYHFISNEEFNKLAARGFFIETGKYREWQYGTAKDFDLTKDSVVVLTPAGARALKRSGEYGKEVVVFYLNVDRKSRLIKMLTRGDDIEEAYRRSLSDVGQFDGFGDEADCTIDNGQYKFSVQQIAETVKSWLALERKSRSGKNI